MKSWWKVLCQFCYCPEPSKSWLITKDKYLEKTSSIFKDTDIQIKTRGKRHLEAVIGDKEFKREYIGEKIKTWIEEIHMLSQIAKTELQAAYLCFSSGYKHKMRTYFMRTFPDFAEDLRKLDDVDSESRLLKI